MSMSLHTHHWAVARSKRGNALLPFKEVRESGFKRRRQSIWDPYLRWRVDSLDGLAPIRQGPQLGRTRWMLVDLVTCQYGIASSYVRKDHACNRHLKREPSEIGFPSVAPIRVVRD